MVTHHLNICIAPLRGVTVAAFREAFARHFGGVDRAVSPFVTTVKGRKVKASVLREVAPERNRSMPLIPQILSKDPDETRVMCRALLDMGYERINLNLGCPFPMVRKRGRGTGLMADEATLRRVMDAACDVMPVGFSVKVRLGIDSPDLLAARVPLFNEYPLDEVMVHARTAEQMYEGGVDLDAFEAVLPAIKHPVVYNGDLFTVADIQRFQARFPSVSRIMLGRGLVADPFLPGRVRGQSGSAEKEGEKIKAFLDDMLDGYCEELFGPAPVLGRMKELWSYLWKGFEDGETLLRRVQQSKRVDAYRRIVAAAQWRCARRKPLDDRSAKGDRPG